MTIQFKQLVISLALVLCMFFGCDDPPPSNPNDIGVGDPGVTVPGCCQTTYSVDISGVSPASGRYYWLAMMLGDSLIKAGTSIFTSGGTYSNRPLSVTISYRDQIQPGDYQLRIMGYDAVVNIGDVRKRVIEESGAVVTVPTFNVMDCFACDTIEIIYRSFIYCPIEDGFPGTSTGWLGFYKGDDRDFMYASDYFRSSQKLALRYQFSNHTWVIDPNHIFGITQQVPSSVVSYNGIQPCEYDLTSTNYTAEDEGQAVAGANGNILSEQLLDATDTAHIRIRLLGYNPLYAVSCGIDGTLDIYLYVEIYNGLPYAYARMEYSHDEFPNHEVYIRRLAGNDYSTFYTFYAGNHDIRYLCDFFSPLLTGSKVWRQIY